MNNSKNNSKLDEGLSHALFAVWVMVAVGLFWIFQFQYEAVWVSFDGEKLPPLQYGEGGVKVVHFVDPYCPCSKFSRPHI